MANQAKTDTRGPVYYIGSAIAILCMLFFGKVVPTWGPVTEVGINCLGCFIGVIIAVIFTGETLWPTMIALISLTLGGYFETIGAAISSVFGASVVWGFFLITAIISAMNDIGTGVAISSILLTRKFFQKKPLLLSYCFLVAFAVATNFMNTVGTMVLGFPILGSLLERAGVKPHEKYAKFMNLGLFLAIVLGWTFRSAVMPEFAFRFDFFREALAGTGVEVNMLVYTLYEVITVFMFFALFVLSMKYVFKCDFGKLSDTDFRQMPEVMEKAKLDKYQITFIVSFLIFALSALVPKSWTVISKIGQYGILGVVCMVLHFMKRKDADGNTVRLFNFDKYLRTVSWNIAVALGLFAVLGTAISSDVCGIKQWLIETVSGPLSNAGSWSLALIVILGVSGITHVFNNSATMTVFAALAAPLCVPFATSGAMNPALLLATIPLGAQSGFLTMAASSTAPILHEREGIDNKFIWTGGLYMELLFMLCSVIVYFGLELIF